MRLTSRAQRHAVRTRTTQTQRCAHAIAQKCRPIKNPYGIGVSLHICDVIFVKRAQNILHGAIGARIANERSVSFMPKRKNFSTDMPVKALRGR
jgi:hypothetical protein